MYQNHGYSAPITPNPLGLLTGCHTAAAQDTFIIITHHMDSRVIQLIVVTLAFIIILVIHTIFPAELLQFTIPASYTGKTFLIMVGQKELQRPLSGLNQLRRVGVNLHSFIYRMHAGCHQVSRTLYFYHAHTAGAISLISFK